MLETNDESVSKPLLDWVLEKFPDTSRNRAKQWIVSGRMQVDGVTIRKPHQPIPEPGSKLELLDRPTSPLGHGEVWQIHPLVQLVHLDSSLTVVNKGAGILSVPAPNRGASALSIVADFLAGRLKYERGWRAKPLPAAYHRLAPLPVHRLDEYTSGLFCLALSPTARQNLINQVRQHTMRREYVAYVQGRSPKQHGAWRHWLKLSPDGLRQEVLLQPKAKERRVGAVEAITHFEVMAEYLSPSTQQWASKLRLKLQTGCRHQIRIQAASAGLPLIGDRLYNPEYKQEKKNNGRIQFSRQALHSELLELEHPEQPGQRLSWRIELPKDLRQLEARLRNVSSRKK